jgi:hypothetical protein
VGYVIVGVQKEKKKEGRSLDLERTFSYYYCYKADCRALNPQACYRAIATGLTIVHLPPIILIVIRFLFSSGNYIFIPIFLVKKKSTPVNSIQS